jgi:hypothetical protein
MASVTENPLRAPELRVTAAPDDSLPMCLELELLVRDAETIAELCRHAEGDPRDAFALDALRIGVLALRQARGQLDADLIKREATNMLSTLDARLGNHAAKVHDTLAGALKEYFDPENGRFNERIKRLVQKDGELERVLREQVGTQDSELTKTLLAHFGETSPLMKMLSPTESQGLLQALRGTVEEQLLEQREKVLSQFSLDNREGALTKLLDELTKKHGVLTEHLSQKIDVVVKEFSLDEDDSALNRLVRNVDRAQKTITNEFSLDNENSALARMKFMLEQTNQAIHGNLSLDDEQSALARLKKELLTLLIDHNKVNQEFQTEVKTTLAAMVARKQESQRSTRHGTEFEDIVGEQLNSYCQPAGDILEPTGKTAGIISRCMVGDFVITLGPECATPEARIVVEAKEDKSYSIAKARNEIRQARENRGAQIGLFIFSSRTAPVGIEPFQRLGDDIFVVWDVERIETDLYLKVGLTLAKALCVKEGQHTEAQSADFLAMESAVKEIEKQVNDLDKISTWATTIGNNSEHIIKQVKKSRQSLEQQIQTLGEKLTDLRTQLGPTDGTAD